MNRNYQFSPIPRAQNKAVSSSTSSYPLNYSPYLLTLVGKNHSMVSVMRREGERKLSSFLNKVCCNPLSYKNPEKPPPPQQHQQLVPYELPALQTERKSGEFERVFCYFDEDGDGKISPAELRNCMRTVGEELSAEEAEAVVGSTDSDGDGLLGFEDFVKLVEVEGEEERGRSLKQAFKVYEMEGRGCITPKSLRRGLARLGERKTMEECAAMITRFDLNRDGVLSFDEFRIMML